MSRKFITEREVNFINRVNHELIEYVVGQEVTYHEISIEESKSSDVYDEGVDKVWKAPVVINALVLWDNETSKISAFGMDSVYSLNVFFHTEELDNRNVKPKEGDFVEYGEVYFEITSVTQPQIVFGQINNKIMTKCVCVPSRQGQFQAGSDSKSDVENTHPVEQSLYDPK